MATLRLRDPSIPAPPEGKYPAKTHARKVAEWISAHSAEQNGTNGASNGTSNGAGKPHGVIYLEGQKTRMIEDDDQAEGFRQRRYFYYLSGCNVPDSSLVYDIDRDHLTLFIPPIDSEEVIWSGLPEVPKEAMQKYDIDACLTTDELNSYLSSSEISKSTIYTIPEQVSPSTSFTAFHSTNSTILKRAIDYSRVTKTPFEIALIRHANAISSAAHQNVMRAVAQIKNEEEIMGAFVGTCISNGGHKQAYSCICAAGTSAATLHYVHNDLTVSKKLNLLIDAGCEYNCYCADVTRSYPLNGTFTKESREIYDLVDRMQDACMEMLRAGVKWEDVHTKAHTTAIDGLLKLGILKGDPNSEEDKKRLLDSRVSTVFLPHGLGHYLGMDTHDTGGDADYSDPDPMFRYLRIRGKVPANAVVTNEPGIYFCRFIIEPALKNEKLGPLIDKDVLDRYWDVGGVRIEDDIWIKEDGYENLTTVSKDTKEIERFIRGEK
ncbi:X-Pro dipeptidase [Myriangium duriaei CBS 260.36]|uniref:Xaa-Pro aminopeptidase n=1 Tax=Myriangium duriaei CBS 260.36 TaxID=1168546 RepID=A0A9P4IYB1_9PEZI|nr:X-Pro dipeptidase [Myriangium duriaei CBS 260.36]